MSAAIPDDVLQALRAASGKKKSVSKADFTLSQGTQGEETVIASFEAPQPIALRTRKALRLVATAVETKQTDGSTDNQETFTLSNDLIDTVNTEAVIIYETNTQQFVRPDSFDAGNDQVTYTDNGNANYDIEIYYVPSNAGKLQFYRVAPQSQGRVEERVFDAVTKLLHSRDQQKRPYQLELEESPLQNILPTNWKLEVRADVPYVADLSGINGLLEVPAVYLDGEIDGLGEAAAMDIVERSSQ